MARQMKIISHRGNINGPSPKENKPEHIQIALDLGFDVEIDVWYYPENKGYFWFGHDEEEYLIEERWLKERQDNIWLHAKNIDAVEKLSFTDMNWFWHEKDKMTLTSKGIPWCYPEVYVENGVTVSFDDDIDVPNYIYGICTDNPLYLREKFK